MVIDTTLGNPSPELVIDTIQDFFASVSSVWSPHLEDYPPSLSELQLPIQMTEIEETIAYGMGISSPVYMNHAIVVRVIWEAIGAIGDLGFIKQNVASLQRDFWYRLFDPDAYAVKGKYVLKKAPERLEIVTGERMFRMTGYQVIEYPVQSEFWFHGFELRFNVNVTYDWTC